MSKPKYKVGDIVTIDTGWDRQVLRTIAISEVSENHGAKGAHRYWGTDEQKQPHGFYEDQVRQGDHPRTRSDWERREPTVRRSDVLEDNRTSTV